MRLAMIALARIFILFALTPCAAAPVRVVGSDLLGADFTRALYAAAAEFPFALVVTLDGSWPALRDVNAGRGDVAMVLATTDEPLDPTLRALPLGYCPLFVLGSADSQFEVSLAQLAALFGDEAARSAEHPVALVPESGAEVMLDYFRHVVLHDRALPSRLEHYRDESDLVHRCASNSQVVTLAATLPAPGRGWRTIPVAARAGEPAFLPTAENLHAGDYPLRLPLRLVFRRDAIPRLRPLLRFLAGDVAAAQLARTAIVPLPAAARAQQLARLTQN